jgi:hypothetical protein
MVLATAVMLILVGLTGCTSENTTTAKEIVTHTLQALRNVTTYQFSANESINATILNQTASSATSQLTVSQETGSVDIPPRKITFNTTSTTNKDQTIHGVFYYINGTIYIGNNTNGNLVWQNTTGYNGTIGWSSWSLLDHEKSTLENMTNPPAQYSSLTFTRKPDTTIANTPCYVISYIIDLNQTSQGSIYSTHQNHTYYIAKNTYNILKHRVDAITAMSASASPTATYATFSENFTYTNYNLPVTITVPPGATPIHT